jgi:hypothetical protein
LKYILFQDEVFYLIKLTFKTAQIHPDHKISYPGDVEDKLRVNRGYLGLGTDQPRLYHRKAYDLHVL